MAMEQFRKISVRKEKYYLPLIEKSLRSIAFEALAEEICEIWY